MCVGAPGLSTRQCAIGPACPRIHASETINPSFAKTPAQRSPWWCAQEAMAWAKHACGGSIPAIADFLKDATNIVLVGPNGIGKSTLAQNIAHQAVVNGHTVMFTSAGQMLGDLSALDSDTALRRRLRHYAAPRLLVIDEVGYLSYSNRHADMLFELISRRYEQKSTMITTNRPFAEWNEVFPNAACVASLVDRLVHHAEILAIDGESYRLKEANERAQKKTPQRRGGKA